MQHPGASSHGIFKQVPCNLAGMDGGRKWHRDRFEGFSQWFVPQFELAPPGAKPSPPPSSPPEDDNAIEVIPVYKHSQWVFVRRDDLASPVLGQAPGSSTDDSSLEAAMQKSVVDYLQGNYDSE